VNGELETVLALVRAQDAVLVNVGHGRSARAVAAAEQFTRAWLDSGGELGVVVSWPVTAASWLRPACRFAHGAPDVWVVADEPAGWAGFGRRLAAQPGWRARRTVGFAGLADPALPELAGRRATDGLRGARTDGTVWTFADGRLEILESVEILESAAWMR
jgi:hypothetical protein